MCRQYKFRFLECGHVYGNPSWRFRSAHHPPGCVMEDVILERSQHCFDCLLKEKMPDSRRNFPLRRPDLCLAADRLNRILIHLRQHPEGPQHLDEANLAALCSEQQKLSEADRSYVEQYEEDCDQWLRAVKDAAEDFDDPHSVEALIQGFYYQRNFVLQLRFAHLTALVHDRENTYTALEKIADAIGEFRIRITERTYAILPEVEIKDLTEDDSCPICYSKLNLRKADDSDKPVKTPCEHMFCEDCILKWLETGTRTCPSCRTNLYRGRENAADWETIRHEVFGPIINPPETPTPWWVTVLKNEQIV
jgi:hypothetical protein